MVKGACMVGACVAGVYMAGGLHGKGGNAWQGGVHGKGYVWRGGHACQEACMAGEMATAVDRTHPTGMHSCYMI